jgi:hypothetical protein
MFSAPKLLFEKPCLQGGLTAPSGENNIASHILVMRMFGFANQIF